MNLGLFRRLRAKLHLSVDLVLAGFDESKALIQPLCRIRVNYLQLQHCAGGPAFLDQSANQFAANSLPAMFGQRGNIQKPAMCRASCCTIMRPIGSWSFSMIWFSAVEYVANTIVVAH